MILLAILCCFLLVVDNMYRNCIRKIRGIYANCQRFLLFNKARLTDESEQTLKNFFCFPNQVKQYGANYERFISDIVNRDTHCKFLYWL